MHKHSSHKNQDSASSSRECFLHNLAGFLDGQDTILAVRIDPSGKRVEYAVEAGHQRSGLKKELEAVLSEFEPQSPEGCVDGTAGGVSCRKSGRASGADFPRSVRVQCLDDGEILVQKRQCPVVPHRWEWFRANWRLRPRQYGLPFEIQDVSEWKVHLVFAGLCGFFALSGLAAERMAASLSGLAVAAYAVAYMFGAWHTLGEVVELIRKRVLDIHFLMICVAVGAAVIGHLWEGALLLFLFSLSEGLEGMTIARTEREIESLFKEAPKEARVVHSDGTDERIPVEALRPGMIIRVRPGEWIPVDSVITVGETSVDEANISGESLPVEKKRGESLFSGTVNDWGRVEARVLRRADESMLARIIRLIREAQESKAPAQRFTDRFSTGYTYTILALCLVMFFVWWGVFGLPPFRSGESVSAFYRAMTLLVVASPCALVLSIPSAILAGIASGARQGILFRGGAAIEGLAEVRRVVFDKTGTVTTGELDVTKIESFPVGQEEALKRGLLSLAANSNHPLDRAVCRAIERQGFEPHAVTGFAAEPGLGLRGSLRIDGDRPTEARFGKRSWFSTENWTDSVPPPGPGMTDSFFSAGSLRGRVLFKDQIRTAVKPLIEKLSQEGLKICMLTGDRRETAEDVAEATGIPEFESGLSPEDKVQFIRRYQEGGDRVAMIGDGVNDAPGLTASDIAVGMGVRGSDVVLEQADVILMRDRLELFERAFQISRRARAIIRQNLVVSLGVIAVLVTSALGGWIPLTLGVIGHEGSTVLVVFNSLRLLIRQPDEDASEVNP